ncbi:hypothetical protein LCL87_15500 [Rhodococcus hoagii]|nr:hypothetical protein [Prescottella equi]
MRIGSKFVDGGGLFERERRGYSTRQVEDRLREIDTRERSHLSRIRQLEHEMTLLVRQRDWECQLSTDRKNQIDSLQNRIAQLTEELSDLERPVASNVAPGTRIQKMLTLAEEEARSVVHEAQSVADGIAAAATEESRELIKTSKDRLAAADSKLEEAESECLRLVGDAREAARGIAADAARLRDEIEAETKFRREHMDAMLRSEVERNRQQAETLMREQEDEALRAAEEIVATAKVEAAALMQKAHFFVENYRREFERFELSRNASVSQMSALRDSLEGLIRSCGQIRGVPELEPRVDQAVYV